MFLDKGGLLEADSLRAGEGLPPCWCLSVFVGVLFVVRAHTLPVRAPTVGVFFGAVGVFSHIFPYGECVRLHSPGCSSGGYTTYLLPPTPRARTRAGARIPTTLPCAPGSIHSWAVCGGVSCWCVCLRRESAV